MSWRHKFDEMEGVDSDWLLEAAARRKKILFFFALIAAAVILAVVGFRLRVRTLEGEKKTQTERQIFEWNDEIKEYEKQLGELQEKYADRINGKSCIILAFTNLSKGDARGVLELMDAKGYAGLMVFTDGKVPGDVNCITVEEYQTLLGKGWEAAIGSSASQSLQGLTTEYTVTKWEDYVKAVRQKFADKGLEIPRIYCFNEGETHDKAAPLLENMGFEVYITISDDKEACWFSAQGSEKTVLTGVQADYDCGTMREVIQSNTAKGYSCVFLFNRIEFGYPQKDSDVNTSISRFQTILENLERAEREVYITTVSGYGAYQEELDAAMTGDRAEYVEQRNAVLEKIKELRVQIERLEESLP